MNNAFSLQYKFQVVTIARFVLIRIIKPPRVYVRLQGNHDHAI